MKNKQKFNFENISKNKPQEYILCEPQNDLGIIALSKESFETIAAIAISENNEVVVNKSKRYVTCKIIEGKLDIEAEIKFKYGSDVNSITQKLQEKIYQAVIDMTGFKTNKIDIKIVGFEF